MSTDRPGCKVSALSYTVPAAELTNDAIAEAIPKWTPEQILKKTGIERRHVASGDQCGSDFATAAALRLIEAGLVDREKIDFLFLVTQTPDHFLPATACVVHGRLGLGTHVAAFDVNQGCSGYVYALGLAQAWIGAGFGSYGLVLTGDTYTRTIASDDSGTRTLFGDGGTATLVESCPTGEGVGSFVFGSDGRGAENLIIGYGGFRPASGPAADDTRPTLRMNGPEIFTFTLDAVPAAVNACLAEAGLAVDDVDLYVFHQANVFMLEHLRDRIGIPPEKFVIAMRDCGNTVSSSIPLALTDLVLADAVKPGSLLLFVGFGVGYSWAACLLRVGHDGLRAVPGGTL